MGNIKIVMVWMLVLIVMFVTTIMYVVMSDPLDTMTDAFVPDLAAEDLATYDKIDNMWHDWPVYVYVVSIAAGAFATFVLSNEQNYYN